MKLLILSDTHGRIEAAEELYGRLTGIDRILHLGDLTTDASRLAADLGVEVISVPGNMDGSFSKGDHQVLETEWGRILLVHGHMHQAKSGLLKLRYQAEESNCGAVFFGHTHSPLWIKEDGIYFLNPGSLSLPRGGTQGSYAIVHTSAEELEASVLYLPRKR